MNFIDFHTHLDWYEDEEQLFLQLKAFDGKIISASVDDKSYAKNLKIANKAKALGYSVEIIPTFGIHPQKTLTVPDNLAVFNELCDSSKIIGEIGMDFCWYKEAGPVQQEKVFRYFLEHCNKTGKYCVIHTKDAEQQIADILTDYPNAKPIIHWYDGPENIFKEFVKRGYYQTFGCQTVRSKHIQSLLKQLPLDLLLAETDNPTAEPWLGGTDNSVQLIQRVYKEIAAVLNLPLNSVVNQINKNAASIL